MEGPELEAGQAVRCRLPGRRTFVTYVVARRPDDSIDVADPRNGGIRTLRSEFVEPVRGKRALQVVAEIQAVTKAARPSRGVRRK